jgi:erythromycin esterase-like protein
MKTTIHIRLAALALVLAGCDNGPSGPSAGHDQILQDVRAAAIPLTGAATDYDPLLNLVGNRRFVLLGEATHGTHEFYQERAEISQRLIAERQFDAVIVEGEWMDAWRVNQYVRGQGSDPSAQAALSGFNQFPLWMWRNAEVAGFVEWLRTRNAGRPAGQHVGFYGMDVYGFYQSIQEIQRILDQVDPAAAARARQRYACFQPYTSPEQYGSGVAGTPAENCADEARAAFDELQARFAASPADEQRFQLVQNARVVMNGEEFYRITYRGGDAWNVRDEHMAETVNALSTHLRARGTSGRIAVWAHNTHVGDARATEMGQGGMRTVGEMLRMEHGNDVGLVGFTTYTGAVIASTAWGQPGQVRQVTPALPESWEYLFHQVGTPNFLLIVQGQPVAESLDASLLQRAIGVSYITQSERQSHYFQARLGEEFDAVIHIDQTTALTPLAQ